MFKVVTAFVEQPTYWIVCDQKNCAAASTGPADLTEGKTIKATQETFLLACREQGWLIGLDAQLCPAHHQLLRRPGQPLEKPLVTLAGSVPGVGKLVGQTAESNVRELRRLHGAD